MGNEAKKVMMILLKMIAQIIFVIVIVMIFVTLVSKSYDLGYRIFHTPAVSEGEGYEVTVTIVEGESVREVANRLQTAGVIKDKEVFEMQKLFYGFKIKAGTYKISTSNTSKEILQILNNGPTQEEETEETTQ
jgi:UPF0755 protein